jgi:multiple sugar transport system substrate-binding protein
MKKVLVVLFACLFLGSLVSAQKLTIWMTGSERNGETLSAAASVFERLNQGVDVQVQAIPWRDGHAKILTAAISGVGPDLMIGGTSWGIEFGQLGGMVNLREEYPKLLADIEEAVVPEAYRSVVPPNGEVHAVPFNLQVMMMYYRQDLLAEAGIDAPPRTWDELLTAASALRARGSKGLALSWGSGLWLAYFPFLYQAGGRLYDLDCSQATINSPEGVEALRFYVSLYRDYDAPADAKEADLNSLLANGYPIGYGNAVPLASLAATHPELDGAWDVAVLPAGPSGRSTSFVGGRVVGIMAASRQPDLAAEFIRFLYGDEATAAMSQKAAELNQDHIPPAAALVSSMRLARSHAEVLQAQLIDAEGPPNCPGWEESAAAVTKQIQEAIFNDADPQLVLDRAAAEMNRNLNQ